MLEDEPVLTLSQQLAFVAWRDLCGERFASYSPGPIPWRAMVAWWDRYEVDDAEFFIEVVQAIDAEWLGGSKSSQAHRVSHPAHARGQERHGPQAVHGGGRESLG